MAKQSFSILNINDLKSFLGQLGTQLEIDLIKELLDQGHKATGKLIASVQSEVALYTDSIELAMSYLKYGVYLEKGIKVSQYRKMPSQAEILALMKWLKVKRLVSTLDKKARGFAWAIAMKHRKKGFPSPDAKRFSPSGRILRFQSYVLRARRDYIGKKLSKLTGDSISTSLNDLVNNITKRFS